MKKMILLINILLYSSLAFSQSLKIYKTDKTSVQFTIANVDSITFSATPPAAAMAMLNWRCLLTEPALETLTTADGELEQTPEGLKIYGHGLSYHKMVIPAAIADTPVMDKTVYLKWKAVNQVSNMAITIALYADTTSWRPAICKSSFSIQQGDNSSLIIDGDTWYYTRLVISGNTARSVTTTGNYDIYGGTVIIQESSLLSEPVQTFALGIGADQESFVILQAQIE